MALRTILQDGDETLRKKSKKVTDFNERLHTLLDDMRETLLAANGLGLAAPQVGVLRRVVLVIDDEDNVIELINPEIVSTEGEVEDAEGCLSFPGLYGLVVRPERVTVKAQDRNGNEFTASGEGMTARCFCHEVDHLNGELFTDKVVRYLDTKQETGEDGE
ncbi:peptide deformylase [Oscillospiraceae bacterium OttesenSCG-928-G22]|nr:peptide deformylase [Oscillospiraceae bacterium OttesenSCG-928-G22]